MPTEISEPARDILSDAVAVFGPELQMRIAIEEMSELTKELCKNMRGANNTEAIAEEIADVHITLEQMIYLHDCGELVSKHYSAKLKRLARRVDDARHAKRSEA